MWGEGAKTTTHLIQTHSPQLGLEGVLFVAFIHKHDVDSTVMDILCARRWGCTGGRPVREFMMATASSLNLKALKGYPGSTAECVVSMRLRRLEGGRGREKLADQTRRF